MERMQGVAFAVMFATMAVLFTTLVAEYFVSREVEAILEGVQFWSFGAFCYGLLLLTVSYVAYTIHERRSKRSK